MLALVLAGRGDLDLMTYVLPARAPASSRPGARGRPVRPERELPTAPSRSGVRHAASIAAGRMAQRGDTQGPRAPGPAFSFGFSRIPVHSSASGLLRPSQVPIESSEGPHLRGDQHDQEAERPAQEVPVASWDVSKIPVFPPDRPNRPQAPSLFTAPLPSAIHTNLAIGRVDDPLEHEVHDRKDAAAPEPTKARPLAAVESALASEGSILDSETRAIMESRFGNDFSKVRVHTGPEAQLATQSIGAVACTFDRHIVLDAPSIRAAGRDLLAHELAHVVQQGDADRPTRVSHPDEASELAADGAADAVATGRPAHLTPQHHLAGTVMRQPPNPAHARGYAGEQGMGFAGYPAPTWALIEGPSGAAGHGVTTRGFDAVAVRVEGNFEIHLVDNKSLARAGNVSSATALTRNLASNLDALITRVNGAAYNDFPQIAQVRTALTQARTALNTPGAQLPSNVRVIVTNFGGQSTGVTADLAARGVQFRNLNAPPTGGAPPTGAPRTQSLPSGPGGPAGPGAQTGQSGGPGGQASAPGSAARAVPQPQGPVRQGGTAAAAARPAASSLAEPLAKQLGEQQRFLRRAITITRVLKVGLVVLQVIGELDTAFSMINMAQKKAAGEAFLLDKELKRAEDLAGEATTMQREYEAYSKRLTTWKWELLGLLNPPRGRVVAAAVDALSLLGDQDLLIGDLDERIGRLAKLQKVTEARERFAEEMLKSPVVGTGAFAATIFGAYLDLGHINGALSRAMSALTAERAAAAADKPFFLNYVRQCQEWIATYDQQHGGTP